MANLTHIFKPGQKVFCNFDGSLLPGTVTETHNNYILVDVPTISDHCYFENDFNIGNVYPEYNMTLQKGGVA